MYQAFLIATTVTKYIRRNPHSKRISRELCVHRQLNLSVIKAVTAVNIDVLELVTGSY